MTTGKTIALTRWTFVDKVMSLLFNMLSKLVITFLLRSKHLLISWLQSPSAVILEPRKIKSATVSTVSPSISSISQKEKDVQNQGGDLARIQHADLLWSKCAEIIYSLWHLKIRAISYKELDFWSPGFPGGSVVKNPPAMQETQESWVQFLGWDDPLEEGMATHSSILAWRIPWTEEPGELQSMGSQRVRQD